MKHVLSVVLAIMLMATVAMAGPNSRTVDMEAYETINMSVDVPSVVTDPATFDEALCTIITKADWYCAEYEQIPDYETLVVDIRDTQRGESHVFEAPDGTFSVYGEYRDCYHNSWFSNDYRTNPKYCYNSPWFNYWRYGSEYLTNNGDSNNWKFDGGNHDEYLKVEATYQNVAGYHDGECIEDAYVYTPQVVCPPDAVITHTVTVNYSFDKVVTEVMSGDTITVRGHIWTRTMKPVSYRYIAQTANIPANAVTIAKSDKVLVPDVNGVYATDSWSFEAPVVKKDTIVRIFLRIWKIDGTIGEIRTKVVVHPRPIKECPTGMIDCN